MSGGRRHDFDRQSSWNSGRDVSHDSQKRPPVSYRVNSGKTEMRIIQGDITKTKVDAIVNAANEHMTGGSGVDGFIHGAAGPSLRDECYRHREVERGVRLPTGRSRILLSYDLKRYTHYIINTAGPIYNSFAAKKCEEQLSSCYKTAMALANLYDLESIAFPAISCGIFGYPADKGAETAMKMVDSHSENLKLVIFVLFDDHIYDAWVKKAKELDFDAFDAVKKSNSDEREKTDSSTPSSGDVTVSQGLGSDTAQQSDRQVPSSPDPNPDNIQSGPTDHTPHDSESNATNQSGDSARTDARSGDQNPSDSDSTVGNATPNPVNSGSS